jgi:hypothetical protein
MERREQIKCDENCDSLDEFSDYVRTTIAARDKWWLGLLQEVNEANDLKDLQERFAHLLRYVADLGIEREVGQ